MYLDMAGVAMWSVLYRPMNNRMCFTLVMCSSFVFNRELLQCGDTEMKPPSCQIQPPMSAVLGKIIVLWGSTLRLARYNFEGFLCNWWLLLVVYHLLWYPVFWLLCLPWYRWRESLPSVHPVLQIVRVSLGQILTVLWALRMVSLFPATAGLHSMWFW